MEQNMLSDSVQNTGVMTETKEEKTLEQLMAECNFTAEELRTIDSYAAQIDVMDNNEILEYGVGCQKKLTDFSESALNNVKTWNRQAGSFYAKTLRTW